MTGLRCSPAGEQRPCPCCKAHQSVAELLADDLIQAVMRADHVAPDVIEQLLIDVADHRRSEATQ